MSAVIEAHVLVVGGGIVGTSICYHLAKMGVRNVVLIEKNQLTHGATWHAAGLVGQLRSSRNTTRMLKKSVELYDRLEQEVGHSIDWKKVGSLRLACTPDRVLELKRAQTMAKSFGLELELISASDAQKLFPVMSTEKVLCAAYIPSDGYIDPSSVTQALAKVAKQNSVSILEGVAVEQVFTDRDRITSVMTNIGLIKCDIIVNASGMWARELGQLSNVRIPACALEHQYLVTEPIPGLPDNMPTMRDPDHLVYYKPEAGALAIGGYEQGTLPFGDLGIPKKFGKELLQENWERFSPLAENAAFRTPVVGEVGIRKLINGPIPYSADSDFVMGKVTEYDNYYVASGFLYGIAAGGGAGQMMAEWIVDGQPSLDLWPLDVRRFNVHHNSSYFMYPRAIELYGQHYTQHFPFEEHHSVRGIRKSPLYQTLKEARAMFGSRGGWERAMWFAPEGTLPEEKPCFGRPHWFEYVAMEHRAVRERVALIDQTSFSKIEVCGKGALQALQKLTVTDLNRPVGKTTYTQMCNEKGGIEADLTISRIAEDRFYIVTGSAFGVHDLHWIKQNIKNEPDVYAFDVTSSRVVINICGPYAREVLQKVSETSLAPTDFKFCDCREFYIGAAWTLAIRIGYVGELGWELHIPAEYAQHVYDLLWEKGQAYGIANVGYRAIDSLRLEKGYLYWSADITPDYTPLEAGLDFKVSFTRKGDFIGRKALEKQKEEGINQRIYPFTLEEDVMVYGGEAIYAGDKIISVTTSGGFGFTIGKPIVYGYIPRELWQENDFYVESFGQKVRAHKHSEPLYDPQNLRLKN